MINMNDVIFWLGFIFGVCGVLTLGLFGIIGFLIYNKIRGE